MVDLAVPFVLSRMVLLVVMGLVSDLPRGLIWVAQFSQRGWAYSTTRWLDVWARWDSDWYLRIIKNGYEVAGYATGEYTSLAFFPLYPETVRLFYRLLPAAWQGTQAALVLGIVVSNLCMLGALAGLYWHVRVRFADRAMAQRTVAYLLAFPTAFFLGCVYTESAFLLLAVLT
jgi:Gpi18-like mannosyltransferase